MSCCIRCSMCRVADPGSVRCDGATMRHRIARMVATLPCATEGRLPRSQIAAEAAPDPPLTQIGRRTILRAFALLQKIGAESQEIICGSTYVNYRRATVIAASSTRRPSRSQLRRRNKAVKAIAPERSQTVEQRSAPRVVTALSPNDDSIRIACERVVAIIPAVPKR